jgi:hypothetical protein
MSTKPRIEGAARQVIISSGIRAMGLLIATLLLGLVGLTLLTTVGAEAWRMVAAATPATAWRSPVGGRTASTQSRSSWVSIPTTKMWPIWASVSCPFTSYAAL